MIPKRYDKIFIPLFQVKIEESSQRKRKISRILSFETCSNSNPHQNQKISKRIIITRRN